jgi:hypothetical protein
MLNLFDPVYGPAQSARFEGMTTTGVIKKSTFAPKKFVRVTVGVTIIWYNGLVK